MTVKHRHAPPACSIIESNTPQSVQHADLCSPLWRGHIGSLPNPNKQVRHLLAFNSRCKCNFIFNFDSLAVTPGRATSKLQPCTWGHYLHFYILCRFSAYGNILPLDFFFFCVCSYKSAVSTIKYSWPATDVAPIVTQKKRNEIKI